MRAELPEIRSPKPGRLAKAIVVAAALHAPLVPKLGRMIEDRVEDAKDLWNRSDAVLHVQSDGEKAEVRKRVRDRETRTDPEVREATKQKYREQLEKGESISFKQLYFDMEQVNGVPAERVEQAKRLADSDIRKYVEAAQGNLSDPLIRRIVSDLYDARKYEFGAASVSDCYLDGKCNCFSTAKRELITFEGVIQSLPEPSRKRFELGIRMVQQHQIATLGIRSQADAAPEQVYLLEPSMKVETRQTDRSGTADVGLDLLKKSMVAEKPVVIQAATGDTLVASSPRLDVETDQPVSDGIVVEGRLRGSDFVRHLAEERGIEPEIEKKSDVMEVTFEKEKFDPETLKAKSIGRGDAPPLLFIGDLDSPTPERIAALKGLDSSTTVHAQKIGSWDVKNIRAMLALPYENWEFGQLSPSVIAVLKERVIERPFEKVGVFAANASPEELKVFLKALPHVRYLGVYLSNDLSRCVSQMNALTEATQEEIELMRDGESVRATFSDIRAEDVEVLTRIKSRLSMDVFSLVQVFTLKPELLHDQKFQYSEMGADVDMIKEGIPTLYRLVKKEAPERTDLLRSMRKIMEPYLTDDYHADFRPIIKELLAL